MSSTSEPRPWTRAAALAREATAIARAHPIASTVTALIVAAACATILATTGRTVQAETDVMARIDEAGTRSIVITDTTAAAGIHPDALHRIRGLSTVEWAIGLGHARDVTAAGIPGGQPVPTRTIHGQLPPPLHTSPWDAEPGTALVGPHAQQRLGLTHPAGGAVRDDLDLAIVGWFHAHDPLDDLNRTLLVAPDPDHPDPTLGSIQIFVTHPQHVDETARQALLLTNAADHDALRLETSGAINDIRAAVQGQLGDFSRNLIALILAATLVLIAINVYGTAASRRHDFGRRRALGATRTDIITLVTLQTTTIATISAAIGTASGTALVWHWTGAPPQPAFTASIATLAVLTATTAALPPATIAATRDPVRVLRIP